MICQRCGKESPPGYGYCQTCGTPLPTYVQPQQQPYAPYSAQQQQYPPPPPQGYVPAAEFGPSNYAGIGARFLAALMDGVILGIPVGIISTALSAMMAARVIHRTSRETSLNPGMAADALATFFTGFGLIMIISVLLTWAYFALLESSSWQGTVGKKIMGIQVADLQGSRITLGRATVRVAVKALLSGWFLIGYIIALFTRRKQALHDLIAGTLVLTKQPAQANAYPGYPPQPNPYGQQQYCPYCGGGIAPGSRFCSNCGANL